MKTVTYTLTADRALARLPSETRERIEAKIERYAATGQGDVKAMKGVPVLRLRVGNYRVIFTEDHQVLDVLDVGDRSQIYQ